MIAKLVYIGKCVNSGLVGWPQKRYIDIMKYCLKKEEVWMSVKEGE